MYISIAIAYFLCIQIFCISFNYEIFHRYKHNKNIIFKERFDVTLRSTVNQNFWINPKSGLKMEILISKAMKTNHNASTIESHKAPILFIHGSFHSAWCYSENYMEFFNRLGHDCYSVSLRGTANTGMSSNDNNNNDNDNKVSITQHISDMSFIISRLNHQYSDEGINYSKAPIIIAHSFGGLLAMKLLEIEEIRNKISGVALLCSVPPSGNSEMTKRFMKRNFFSAMKIVWGFVLKAATFSPNICQELFFDQSVSITDIKRYMSKFQDDSKVSLDLISLASQLPSKNMTANGVAEWIDSSNHFNNNYDDNNKHIDSSSNSLHNDQQIKYGIGKIKTLSGSYHLPARLVIGAKNDFIVDIQGVEETAIYMGLKNLTSCTNTDMNTTTADMNTLNQSSSFEIRNGAVILPDLYHDVMLGPKWEVACSVIANWIYETAI